MDYINVIKAILKMCITVALENILKLFWILPVDNRKVMFISYTGDYSDSPKYTYLKLRERHPELRCVWAVNPISIREREIDDCRKVQFGSLRYIMEICTSKVVVTNNFLNTYIPRRREQEIVNTWHGGSPVKRAGIAGGSVSAFDRFFFAVHARKYSLFLSSSEFMTNEVFRKSFLYHGKIFPCGLPRNAVLFRNPTFAVRRVSEYYHIPIDDENGIILYAPTFRGDSRNAGFIADELCFNIHVCLRAMEAGFHKKFRFMFRSHYFKNKADLPNDCLTASDYPDMQELLLSADILITDYSSCMGDMCLMNKPVFLYIPDLDVYTHDTGLYWDIFSLPFPAARNERELLGNIESFRQDEYIKRTAAYLERLKSWEGPDSDVIFADYLAKLMGVNGEG